MLRWLSRVTIVVLLIGFLFLPGEALAQDGVALSSLEVDLWPEYDSPEVLVIYRITLPPSVTLPAELTLHIPASSGEPNAVAVRDANGMLSNLNYERQVDGDQALVSFTATMPEVQFEYYDFGLVKQGANRTFEYRWPGDYAVDFLTIQAQQPLGASEMSLSPAADSSQTGQDGLVYQNKRVGALVQGQTFTQRFSYKKDSDALSVENLQVKPIVPVAETPSSENNLAAIVPWVLGFLGVALLVGGGLWYWQSGKREDTSQPRRKRRTAATSQGAAAEPGAHIYCHQCGKRASAGDRFCRACGTKLRLE